MCWNRTLTAMKKRKSPAIPLAAKEAFEKAFARTKNSAMDGYWRGRFFYVTMDERPMCRFVYEGDERVWGFSIYKYSTESYSHDSFADFLMPNQGTVQDCLEIAMNAYNL